MKETIGSKSDNKQSADIYSLLKPFESEYTSDITGDACKGDKIVFAEAVFTGSFKSPKFSHFTVVEGEIVKDSYGTEKQQHTFTIQTDAGKIIRKARNVYRYGTFGKPRDPSAREISLSDKHTRGTVAREERDQRRSEDEFFV